MAEDPVAHLPGGVEPLSVAPEPLDRPQGMVVVPEALAVALTHAVVEHLLAHVPERRVPEVVTEPDGLSQVLVEAQRPGHVAGDAGGLERVGQPGAVVVALRR